MDYSHFTLEERLELQSLAERGIRAVEIGYRLDKDPTSVSRELKRNRLKQKRLFNNTNPSTFCARFRECAREELCGEACIGRACKHCKRTGCINVCEDYEKRTCPRTRRFPYVCNGCEGYRRCPLERYLYNGATAHAKAAEKASSSRQGIDLTGAELARIEGIVSPLMRKGQSLGQIHAAHGREIPCSLKTLYTYVNSGVFDVGRMHMISAVRTKPRKKANAPSATPRATLAGRSYADFCALDEDVREARWEIDTVIGRVGGKCLLTLLHRLTRFMLCLLLDRKASECVVAALDLLESALERPFGEAVPLILADNGTEFFDVDGIERGGRTKLYYCESYSSWQKGAIEKNHTLIRRILPKKTSFDGLSGDDCAKLMSHINSVPRPILGGATPAELVAPIMGAAALEAFGVECIPRDQVCLKPSLLG